jgi:hypothetical protein
MTKTDMFAGRCSGNDIANLDIVFGDDHPINQEFHQLPPLFKGRMIQSALDTLTKRFN